MPGCAMVRFTLSSATMPPNALRSPATSRMAGMSRTFGINPPEHRDDQAAYAARRIKRHQHEDNSEDHQPQFVGDAEHLGNRDEQHRTYQRSEQITRPAED